VRVGTRVGFGFHQGDAAGAVVRKHPRKGIKVRRVGKRKGKFLAMAGKRLVIPGGEEQGFLENRKGRDFSLIGGGDC